MAGSESYPHLEVTEADIGPLMATRLAREARVRVVRQASHLVDVLTNVVLGVRREPRFHPSMPAEDLAVIHEGRHTPPEMPYLRLPFDRPEIGALLGSLGVSSEYPVDLGTYIAEKFPNQTPSDGLNAAFYAGVLAAKMGLVDVDDFEYVEPRE